MCALAIRSGITPEQWLAMEPGWLETALDLLEQEAADARGEA